MKWLLFALALLVAGNAWARPVDWSDPNTIPTEGLAGYDGFRVPLLSRGWKPMPQNNSYEDGFPEVVCGNAACSASWKRPDGSEVDFTLWPRYSEDDRLILFIAPAWD